MFWRESQGPEMFGHAQRRDSEYFGRRMMRLEQPGRRPRRGQKNEIYGCNERRHEVSVREEDSE